MGSVVGRYLRARNIPAKVVAPYKMEDPLNSLNFYADATINGTDSVKYVTDKKYILTMDKGLRELKEKGYAFDMEKQGMLFKVSELTPEFLNPATRNKAARSYYLLRLK